MQEEEGIVPMRAMPGIGMRRQSLTCLLRSAQDVLKGWMRE
jgi:hypothetical protein